MKRQLLDAAAAASLAAFLASGVFWVRSMRFTESQGGESVSFRKSDPRWWVISCRGKLTLCRQNGREWGKEFGDVAALGFRFGGLRGPAGSLWNLAVPYWFICSASLALPAWATCHCWGERRRKRPGLCGRCGYDLRCTPDRCPECGTAPAVPAAAVVG
jgi:hypothetical protein